MEGKRGSMDCRVIMWAAQNCELCFPPSLPTQGGSAGYGELCKSPAKAHARLKYCAMVRFGLMQMAYNGGTFCERFAELNLIFLENAVFYSLPNHSAVK